MGSARSCSRPRGRDRDLATTAKSPAPPPPPPARTAAEPAKVQPVRRESACEKRVQPKATPGWLRREWDSMQANDINIVAEPLGAVAQSPEDAESLTAASTEPQGRVVGAGGPAGQLSAQLTVPVMELPALAHCLAVQVIEIREDTALVRASRAPVLG